MFKDFCFDQFSNFLLVFNATLFPLLPPSFRNPVPYQSLLFLLLFCAFSNLHASLATELVTLKTTQQRYNLTNDLQILEVDNEQVRKQQVQRLKETKENRNNLKVKNALSALTEAAKNKTKEADTEQNLLALAVEAAKHRATLGEISDALEKVYGRHKAKIQSFTGVYSKEIKDDESFKKALALADEFAISEGRRPRIMIAKMGQDGHDRGAKVVATGYADLGFDVDIGPLFQTPEEAAQQAVENDVHILGVSSLAAGHKTLVPAVIKELKKYGREDIMVIVGGVVPKQDYQFLFDAGAVAVFGPGTKLSDAAIQVLEILMD